MALLLFWRFQFEIQSLKKSSPTGVWHFTCIAFFDLKTLIWVFLAKHQQHIKDFQRRASPFLWLEHVIKGCGVHWPGQECVTKCARACFLIVQACISHHHRKWPAVCFEVPAEFFIILTISGDARHQTNIPSIHIRICMCTDTRIAVALHSPSGAHYSEPCLSMPLRMQNKRLLA